MESQEGASKDPPKNGGKSKGKKEDTWGFMGGTVEDEGDEEEDQDDDNESPPSTKGSKDSKSAPRGYAIALEPKVLATFIKINDLW